MDGPEVVVTSNGESDFGVGTIIEIMSEVEEVQIGGISHHIGLIDRDQEFLGLNDDLSLIVDVDSRRCREVDSFNDLIATASRNVDIELIGVRPAVDGVLDVLYFQVKVLEGGRGLSEQVGGHEVLHSFALD
jgi:hypothetical protein